MKSIVVYKGKYGATKQYAEWLGADLGIPVLEASQADARTIKKFDCIIMGSSVYIGKILLRPWMKEFADILKDKKLFVFIVCATESAEKEKLEEIARENVDGMFPQRPTVFFLHGRMIKSKLGWLDRFMLKMGARMQKDPAVKQHMLQDFDDVLKINLQPLESAVKAQIPVKYAEQV